MYITRRTLLFLPLFFAFALQAQFQTKTVEDTYDLPEGKQANLELKFARDIIVHTWPQPELKLQKHFTFSDPEYIQFHEATVKDSDASLSIETGFKEDEMKNREYHCWSCDNEGSEREGCICFRVSYEIWLPADADLVLETISGDIEMRGFQGPARVKSISGFLDVGLPGRASAQLSFHSVTGEIYTDFDITLDEKSSPYSKKLNKPLNGGGPLMKLETVSGDIFFRKI